MHARIHLGWLAVVGLQREHRFWLVLGLPVRHPMTPAGATGSDKQRSDCLRAKLRCPWLSSTPDWGVHRDDNTRDLI